MTDTPAVAAATATATGAWVGNCRFETFATYEDFKARASFHALSNVADITMMASPLECGADLLAARGVAFPASLRV